MTHKSKSSIGAVLAAGLAGAAAVAAFAPLQWWPLAPLALAVLFRLWLGTDSPRRAALLGFAFGLGYFGVGVSWLYISLHEFAGMPAAFAALATALFCAYLALFPALVGSLQARLDAAPPIRLLLLIPGLWMLAEWMRGWLLTGFPWIAIGYSQTGAPLAGFAPLAGVYGISFVLAIVAGLLALFIAGGKHTRIWAAASIALLFAAGGALRSVEWTEPTGGPLSVALVQGNIAQSMKFDPVRYAQTLAIYRRLVLGSHARLTVLPETAIPRFLNQVDPRYLDELARHARSEHGDILLGIPIADPDGRYYNSVISLGSAPRQRYDKSHLVPLGEFVPPEFRWAMRALHIPFSNFSEVGGRHRPLAVAGERVGVAICYEDAFGEDVIRELPQATLLVNVSNDAWFGHSLASEQHLEMSRMRAIESGRMMLRATNSGVTAVIGPRGRVLARLPQFTDGVLVHTVQGRTGATPYVEFGNLPILAIAALLVVAIVLFSLFFARPGGADSRSPDRQTSRRSRQ